MSRADRQSTGGVRLRESGVVLHLCVSVLLIDFLVKITSSRSVSDRLFVDNYIVIGQVSREVEELARNVYEQAS